MKLSAGPGGQRGIPMPLWLQGVLEFVQAAVISALVVLVTLLGVWLTNGFQGQGADWVARLAGQAWLLLHGVPLYLHLAEGKSSADLLSGTISLIPLGLTLIPFFLAWRAGRRLARASYTDQLWQALLGGLVAYAAIAAGTAFITTSEDVTTSGPAATLIPLIPVALGVVIGARREAGAWGRLIGVDAADWVAKTSQHSRWAGSYAWSAIRAGFLAATASAGVAAVLLAVTIAVHYANVITIYESLHPGLVGAAVLTIIQLGYLPNLVIWSLSWASGAGFSLGVGSSVGPLATSVGPLPAFPLLGALPPGQLQFGVVALVIPVAAGVLAGWWFLREGENHLADWLSSRIESRWLAAVVSTLALAVFVGVVAGVLAAAAAWLTGGSMGIGRFTELGPNPLTTAGWVGAEVAVGVLVGCLAAPWLEREPRAPTYK